MKVFITFIYQKHWWIHWLLICAKTQRSISEVLSIKKIDPNKAYGHDVKSIRILKLWQICF